MFMPYTLYIGSHSHILYVVTQPDFFKWLNMCTVWKRKSQYYGMLLLEDPAREARGACWLYVAQHRVFIFFLMIVYVKKDREWDK